LPAALAEIVVEQDETQVHRKTWQHRVWSYCLTDADALAYTPLYHTSMILQHKRLVHHPLGVLKVSGLQSIGQLIIQAIQEAFLLLLISVDFMQGVARQLSELGDVLIHRHGPLLQILELFLLQLDNSLGNMMCTKSSTELRPVDALGFLMAST
jgi:hypothetical protein